MHGTGVFVTEFVPAGTVIWRFIEGRDLILSRSQYEHLPRKEMADWDRFAYTSRFTGLLVYSCDNYVFMNHSHQPNVGARACPEHPEGFDVALRDIRPDEELTFDYTWFGEDPCCRKDERRLPPIENFLRAV